MNDVISPHLAGGEECGEGELLVPQLGDVSLGDLELLPVAVHHEERTHHPARVRVDAQLLEKKKERERSQDEQACVEAMHGDGW